MSESLGLIFYIIEVTLINVHEEKSQLSAISQVMLFTQSDKSVLRNVRKKHFHCFIIQVVFC